MVPVPTLARGDALQQRTAWLERLAQSREETLSLSGCLEGLSRPGQVTRLCWTCSCVSTQAQTSFLSSPHLTSPQLSSAQLRQPRPSLFPGPTHSEVLERPRCERSPSWPAWHRDCPAIGDLFLSLCVVIVEEDPILLPSAVRGSSSLGSPGGLMQLDMFLTLFLHPRRRRGGLDLSYWISIMAHMAA